MTYLNHECEQIIDEYKELNDRTKQLNDEFEELLDQAQEIKCEEVIHVFRNRWSSDHDRYTLTELGRTYECEKVGARCYQVYHGKRLSNYVTGLENWIKGCLSTRYEYDIKRVSGNSRENEERVANDPRALTISYICTRK